MLSPKVKVMDGQGGHKDLSFPGNYNNDSLLDEDFVMEMSSKDFKSS